MTNIGGEMISRVNHLATISSCVEIHTKNNCTPRTHTNTWRIRHESQQIFAPVLEWARVVLCASDHPRPLVILVNRVGRVWVVSTHFNSGKNTFSFFVKSIYRVFVFVGWRKFVLGFHLILPRFDIFFADKSVSDVIYFCWYIRQLHDLDMDGCNGVFMWASELYNGPSD